MVGFAYETRSFAEGAVGDATVLVFGEALQEFSVVYVQGKIFNNICLTFITMINVVLVL